MDKLEKALKKARQQREVELKKQVAQNPASTFPSLRADYSTLTTIAKIEEAHLELYHVLAHRTRNKEADTFRLLRTQVLKAMHEGKFTTLGVTSPNYGDGKTTVALNLAVSIALDLKQTVLLVDLDLRKPSVTEYLGIPGPFGISDYYLNHVPIANCLIRPSFDRLTILPAGQRLENSSEALGSPRIAELARELRARYADRLIIYDMPPTLEQDDPIAFLPHIDALLLVINEGVTQVSELKRTMHILSNANIIGTVLNHSGERRISKPKLANQY